MQTLEFETYSKNGIIEIPKEYDKFIDKKLKVVITTEEDDSHEEKVRKFLKSIEKNKINITEIPNREERNAR